MGPAKEMEARRDPLPLLLELARIPSPPGEEQEVAGWIERYLRDLGLDAERDPSGNLLARIEPSTGGSGTPLFLCAHMDTVPLSAPLAPAVVDGIVRNTPEGILGADNKAAIASILDAARVVLAERRLHAGVELLFTVREEPGCEGAAELDCGRLRAQQGFVFDVEGPIGEVVLAGPFERSIDVTFVGRPAHAGINPEDGRSAIAAAARAVAELQLGRIDEETTSNVGTIQGGTARNVVPEQCSFTADIRSRNERKVEAGLQEILDSCAFAATLGECELKTTVSEKYKGYRFGLDDPLVRIATQALSCCGYTPRFVETNGASDANVFNMRGHACLNLANGVAGIHTGEERIAVGDLVAMVGVILALIDTACDA